jgi:YidC/Oxa1 family membrane protein insertase
VLKDAYKHIPKSSDLYHSLCPSMFQSGGKSYCNSTLTSKIHEALPTLKGFKNGDVLLHHLSFLSIDLQKTATDAHNGILTAAPYFLLVALVMVTGYLQTLQSQKRTPQASKQLGTVMKVLPVFFGVISLSFPAGLVLYFFVSNLFRLGQQEVIFRSYGSMVVPGGGKSPAVDVTSRERVKSAPKVLDPAGAVAVADDDDEDLEPAVEAPKRLTPAKRQARSVARPNPTGEPAEPAEPAEAATAQRGGLRGLFQLPPPPPGNGKPAIPSRPTRAGTSASRGGPRPPQPRSRNKKKRKR